MIKKISGYSLELIDDKPYLLPFGQNRADHRRGILLDRIGLFVWNTLDEVRNENELFFRYAARRSLGVTEFQEGKRDLENFLLDLEKRGFITIDERHLLPELKESFVGGISIGNIRIKLYGKPERFSEHLKTYTDMSVVEPSQADLTVTVTEEIPQGDYQSRLLVHTAERIVAGNKEFFTFLFPSFDLIREARLARNGSWVRVYCKSTETEEEQKRLTEQMDQIFRITYFYAAAQHHKVPLHATQIQYQNRIWLFVGASKQLRMEYANLWNACYGTRILNEDYALCSIREREAILHSVPWGTGDFRYQTSQKKLGGIIFIKAGISNEIEDMPHSSEVLQLTPHIITPTWTESQMHHLYSLSEELTDMTHVWKATLLMGEPAVEMVKSEMDRTLFGA